MRAAQQVFFQQAYIKRKIMTLQVKLVKYIEQTKLMDVVQNKFCRYRSEMPINLETTKLCVKKHLNFETLAQVILALQCSRLIK